MENKLIKEVRIINPDGTYHTVKMCFIESNEEYYILLNFTHLFSSKVSEEVFKVFRKLVEGLT